MKSSLVRTPRRAVPALLALTWLAAGVAGPQGASAQDGADAASEDLRALFPQRARIDTGGTYGLVRAPLPAEVLSSVRADLADMRVFIDDGSVEFVIEADAPQRASETRALVPVDVRERTAGDPTRPTVVETWDVVLPTDVPGAAPDSGSEASGLEWRLRFGLTPSELVRELTVHRVDAQGAETEVLSTTLFRMAVPLREKVEVTIPTAPGVRLRLRLSGTAPALRPTLTLVSESVLRASRELRVPLEVVTTERLGGNETVLTLRRPRGVVPESLVFETTSGAFHREVIVEDAGVGGSARQAGRAVIYRIPDWDEHALEVPLTRTSGDLLRVRIMDQDAPPLEGVSVIARVRQPALVFDAYGSPELFFGGARATRPAYGLGDALRYRLTPDAPVAEASVMDVQSNPRFHAGPVLAFAMRPGASVNVAEFSHALPLRVTETPEGLTRVRPTIAALAAGRQGLGDFRVVDAEGRQWPFLRGDEYREVSVEGAVSVRLVPETRTSVHSITVPAGGLTVDHVLLDVEDSLVDREYQVWVREIPDGEPYAAAAGTLTRVPGVRGPLRVPVGCLAAAIELHVRNGDERPLTLRRATVVTLAPDLFLAAPAGDYRLLVGSDTVDDPRYDIESARDLVLSVRAEEAVLGELADNPEYAPPSPSRDAMTEAALLAVLAVAVLLLALLTFRLVRSEPLEGLAAGPGGSTAQGAVASEDTTESTEGPSDPGAGSEPSDPGEGASPDERDKLPG
jgi:hypothetical protein